MGTMTKEQITAATAAAAAEKDASKVELTLADQEIIKSALNGWQDEHDILTGLNGFISHGQGYSMKMALLDASEHIAVLIDAHEGPALDDDREALVDKHSKIEAVRQKFEPVETRTKCYDVNETGLDHAMAMLEAVEREWHDLEKSGEDFESKYIRDGVAKQLSERHFDPDDGADYWESGAKLAPHSKFSPVGTPGAVIYFDDDDHFDVSEIVEIDETPWTSFVIIAANLDS